MKKLLFIAALLSLTLLVGCAKGGSGPCVTNCPGITISPNISKVGIGVSVPLTVTFVHASTQPVNWSIEPSSCGSACGTLTNVTTSSATYVAPSSIPTQGSFQVVATSQSDSSLTGSLGLTVVPDTTNVAPVSPNVGAGLTQQYTAVALPDQAPQTFAWTCTTANGPCANFSQDPSISGLAYYKPTAGEECGGNGGCVTISAAATIDPGGCSVDTKKFPCVVSTTTVVSQRLSGTYAFQFSGYDSNGKAIAMAGTFTVSSGAVSGFEDELTASGLAQRSFSGGAYNPLSGGNVNSNNAGTLTFNTGVFPSTFNVVLDGDGDVQMTASDGSGNSGSGIAEPSSVNKFNQGTSAVFAFGFTGVDSTNNRIGYVGLLPTNGVSSVSGGLIDVNDNGSASNGICSTAPCPVTGSYTFNSGTNRGQLTLTAPKAMTFDFFVANGNSSNPNNPLNLYAISTDSNPHVVGTMTLQDSKITTYNNAAFSGLSVSALTGASDNVALVLMTTYGDNGNTGVSGACPLTAMGSLTGNFDQNNAGTIVSVSQFPAPAQTPNPYTYVSTNGNTGRYIFCMLGNPGKSPAVLPIPFVLYASGANRGYLLDQSSSSVITGTMNVQTPPKQNAGFFANSSATGTYAVATISNSAPVDSACTELVSCYATMNLLLTSPGNSVFNVTGVENPGSQSFSGVYNVQSSGVGTIGPVSPATSPNFIIYGVTETNFFMIGVDSGATSPILYMAQ